MSTPIKIAIIGFGQEAVSAANYFSHAEILIYDDKKRREIDSSLFKKLKNAATFYFNRPLDQNVDIVVRSPGIRPDHPQIKKLVLNGAKLTSPTKIFFEKCPAPIIGVTGTKGKGTTSTLIYEMLIKDNREVFLAGNIGTPALEILPNVTLNTLVVLELSSFQLIDLNKSPHIAVVLVITSEHLDWHISQQEYWQSKLPIVKYQTPTDFAVINYDFEISKSFQNYTSAKKYFYSASIQTNGVYIEKGSIVSEIKGLEKICSITNVLLPGAHNLQNIAAAVSVAKILNVNNQNIINTLKTFKGLIHRLQFVREIRKIKFYNDSFSTTPETTIAAMESFKNPKVLILGGSSKKSDFRALGKKIKNDKSIKALILIGQEAPRIKKAIGPYGGKVIEGVKNMSEIVNQALRLAKSGEMVLLSPACASFDMFKNYKDRGDKYIKEVLSLRP